MSSPKSNDTPLAVSIGEPAGIGPDIVLKTWVEAAGHLPPFFLLCDPAQLLARANKLSLDVDIAIMSSPEDFQQTVSNSSTTMPVLPLKTGFKGQPGEPNFDDATGIVEAITLAVGCVRDHTARGVVTLPINKKSLYDAGFDYPGHTEFLGALAEEWPGTEPAKPVMMLAGPELRTVPVTIHIPLKDVPNALTSDLIIETARITARDMKSRFGIESPRLAVAGLNPHAGEGGALGHEDDAIIMPAIAQLRAEGIHCIGPLPADTMFHAAARENYDVALCMYHDQALIPAKALAFDEAVNATLGLPFVRTSPDHGTAFDIAGTGKASPSSFIAALRTADEMTNRLQHQHEKIRF